MEEKEEKIQVLERKEYVLKQEEEARSEHNRYYTYKVLGRNDFTDNEAMMHYTLNGGASDFAKKHAIKDVVEQKEAEKNQNKQI